MITGQANSFSTGLWEFVAAKPTVVATFNCSYLHYLACLKDCTANRSVITDSKLRYANYDTKCMKIHGNIACKHFQNTQYFHLQKTIFFSVNLSHFYAKMCVGSETKSSSLFTVLCANFS